MPRPKKSVAKWTAESIRSAVTKKLESVAFSEMRTQIEEDFDTFSLSPFVGEPGHQAYTSPAPRNDFLKVFHSVNKSDLVWQIVTPDDAPRADRDAANRGEALLTGILDRADRTLRRKGEASLRSALAWHGCARGAAALQCLIYRDGSDETLIDIRVLDVLHLAWEQGRDGPEWAASVYVVSKAEVMDRWDTEVEGESATVIDFFDKRINAVVLYSGGGPEQFVKKPAEHGLDHVPLWVGFASGMPTVYTRNWLPTLKQRAASVFASSRNVYSLRNKQVSFVMDVAEKSVAGTLLYENETGTKPIRGDPFGSWQVVSVKIGEKVTPLRPPEVPSASGIVLGVLDRDKQESTVPYPIGYGIDPGAHSGAALAMMNDNTRSTYGPYTSLLADGFQWLCEEILGQFKKKGEKIKLQGFDASGKFFEMEASPEDVHDDWYIVVKCEPKLPRDEAADIQMAMQASAPGPDGEPLLSKLTAREKIVRIQNPDAEQARIENERIQRMISGMPNIQIRRVAMKLLEQGDQEGALELLNSIPAPPGGAAAGPPAAGAAPEGSPPGAPPGNGAMPPEALQRIILGVSQELGIPPEQVAQMPPQEVMSMLQQRRAAGPPAGPAAGMM